MNDKQIRLTTTSYAVLSLLETFGEATPYELKQALEHTIENFWPVPHTTFYEEPARLAKAGYLSQHQESGGRRRKR
jgi:PadR family transcriptional regulator, regulatory protein AphA